jgi:hypothetical protein
MADDFDYEIDGFDDDAWLYVDDEFDLAVSRPCPSLRVPACPLRHAGVLVASRSSESAY